MNKSIYFILVVLIASCTHIIEEDDIIIDDDNPIIEECDPNTVYFENDVLPIISSSCALSGCHDVATGQDGVILVDYQSIISTADVDPSNPNNSELYEVLIEADADKLMPPPSSGISLSNEQISTIFEWINQGAINNACNETNCDSTDVTFSANIDPIINLKCRGCHSGANPQGNILLENYAQIKSLVDDGSFGGAINHESGYVPMPLSQDKLPECEIVQINKWITDGAPNN